MAVQGPRPQRLPLSVGEVVLDDLFDRVRRKRWTDSVAGAGWSHGTSLDRGDIESCFTNSELLTNATICWITRTIRSSMHDYYEHRVDPPVAVRPERIEVPTGVATFPAEIMRVPKESVARKYDLSRWTEMGAGGHFTAMDQPKPLAADIREFFRPFRAG
jgi:pimeloyl-ACP methyl ester carboxylesterase